MRKKLDWKKLTKENGSTFVVKTKNLIFDDEHYNVCVYIN